MKSTDDRLEEVYTGLCNVMRYPQEFGLGAHVPKPLAHLLEETLCTLTDIMRERVFLCENLEAELHQDADRPVITH
jgi:hypothetical protein